MLPKLWGVETIDDDHKAFLLYISQILFCDASELWRDNRKHADSDLHLIPKIKMQVVFSNSIKKDYKLLPRYE